jgi:hypothetical protein
LEVYALAAQREAIMEVTVEDPCEGFQRLRDVVDLEWALMRIMPSLHEFTCDAITNKISVPNAQDMDVSTIARKLKVVPAQMEFILDTISYHRLVRQQQKSDSMQGESVVGQKRPIVDVSLLPDETSAATVVDAMKKFRLKVKKQILKANGDLKGLSKRDMQKELEIMYKESQVRFEACCKKEYLWNIV